MAFEIQINWCNYGQYEIIDVHDKQHEQVQQFMLEHFRACRLFQVLKIQQEEGIENNFIKIVKHILQNECSIMVVDKEFNGIKGVALLKCMTEEWRSWTALQLIIESERFKEMYDMTLWCLQQEDLNFKYNSCKDSLHIFAFHLCKELEQDMEFLPKFFNVIYEVARHMHMPRVTYVSLKQSTHECLQSVGFEEIVKAIYSLFLRNNKRPFDRLRDINEMYAVFYEQKVQYLQPYQEMEIRHDKDDAK